MPLFKASFNSENKKTGRYQSIRQVPAIRGSFNKSKNASTGQRSKITYRRRIRRRKIGAGSTINGARNRLRNFRQASMLAVAITGFFILLLAPGEAGLAQDTLTDTIETTTAPATTGASAREATDEALGSLHNLWNGFLFYLPKLLIAAATLFLAWIITLLLSRLLRKVTGSWASSGAIISLVSIAVWLLAIGIALSVVAGDIRALVGSLGLIGLALSWSLQTPIESFTGWLLNSFQGYYRVGDRVRVGEVFGDVYRIDFLTTTVWEIGSPYQAGFVNAEQPTGRMVTFPNNEILAGSVTNLTGDFPFVWDELAVSVANESDLVLTKQVLEKTAKELLGNYMAEPARRYAALMRKAGLLDHVSEKPDIYITLDDSWTNLVIRYLVGARERRKWKSELIFATNQAISNPEYRNKIIPVYPRQQVQFLNPEGVPVNVTSDTKNM